MPSRQEIIDYITQSAQRRGIDPRVSLRVFHGESGFNPRAKLVTPREASYGITQLNIKNGLGVDALRRGIDPRDPNQWRETIDFSHDQVKRGGWTPWAAARKAGVGRWSGVNSISDTGRTKNIKMGDEPTLQNLTPAKPTRNVKPEDSAEASILRQMAPTEPEQVSEMARPSVKDAIRRAMDEQGIRDKVMMAGFVPPGLTKGSARTRAGANAQVEPKGGMPIERDIGADVGPYNRNAPGTRGMEGSYGDYVRKQHEEMAKGSGAKLPPGVKSATDPAGAADPRTGTALQRVDPTLAAQNDPAQQALIAAKIRGTARPGGAAPPPQIPGNAGAGGVPFGPKAAAATAAVAAGVSAAQDDEDPAVAAVKQKINGAGANVDPGVAAREKQLGAKPGTFSNPNTGWQTNAAGPLIGQALPAFQKVMRDPEGRQAVQTVVKKMAQAGAQQADMQKDPTFYQQMAARNQMKAGGGGGGDPIADRAMERAVMMDRAARPPARPQQQTTRGTVSVRPTLPQEKGDVPNPTEQQIMQQMFGSRGEARVGQGGAITPSFVRSQPIPPTQGGAADPRGAEAYPIPPGANDPTGGVKGMMPSGQMPMDPAMMQLMQFFTGGGNVG